GPFPACEHFVAATGIGPDSDGAAKMVEYDGGVRKCFCQVRQFCDLRMVDPALERQSIISQVCIGAPEIGIKKKVLDYRRPVRRTRRGASRRQYARLRPGCSMTDTPKTLAARGQMSFHHRRGAVA